MKINIGKYPGFKSKKERVIKIQIDPWDTWSMDSTLAMIIVPMLKQLKKTTHGAPNTDDSDVPDFLKSSSAPKKENEYDIDKFHFKRWDWILDEMIWSFTQLNKDWEMKYFKGKADIYFQPLDKDHKLIGEPKKIGKKKTGKKEKIDGVVSYGVVQGPKNTFKVDREGLKKHEDRIKNGIRLFGKYYMSLWD